MMRIVWLVALIGCAPAPSPLGAPCSDAAPCPAGYECDNLSGAETLCYAPCEGHPEECDWLEVGGGVASCSTLGACRIDCQTSADCPAPLRCPDRRFCVR